MVYNGANNLEGKLKSNEFYVLFCLKLCYIIGQLLIIKTCLLDCKDQFAQNITLRWMIPSKVGKIDKKRQKTSEQSFPEHFI